MLKDMTLGQYFPGNSLLHRMDPRMKLILCAVYIVMIFVAKSVSAYILLLAFTALMIACSGISFLTILKSLKPLFFILLFTTVLNLFWSGGETVLWTFGRLTIYLEGVFRALAMSLRIMLLMAGSTVILMYTTSPIALTDAIEQLFAPLAKIGLPVHTFAMMMTMALRFIPTLMEETQKIINAQKARGADFDSGNLLARAKALVPILIPLFIAQFRRAEELATAMECRSYRGGSGRTRMTVLHFACRDYLTALAVAVLCAGIILLNIYFPIYTIL
ncbi:MAG: energy-coupling factor transporter transmembrane protein EcfT [Clostridia bacterium]|nr:energy-coupling factor transporter transmembrane protein EcfT [Clostridia bacterium]